jgi:chemotaxis signal transduction protein
VWVINTTDVIGQNVTIIGGETLIVDGNLLLNGSVVIVVESGGKLQVKGDLISDTTAVIITNSQNSMY